ncbi:sugar-transfer associated ATP-grasp domain-containing protein [Altererythrobacter lutimaris]|uniref:Alpha-L-glutamate ligase-like protein n=1 Tax=Altererythrobacter lutimaris TaxID=2743979 RepID=A0A850H7F0_9SPHN|nr:sugar-transfer associated ATP-grasp domain-containing protein [Altererythrobacter lutimaris]NVE95194.1 alpha-L-glutamate ligase-like protein [Altererythrobacter lutimaris]
MRIDIRKIVAESQVERGVRQEIVAQAPQEMRRPGGAPPRPLDEILGINMRNALIAKYNPRKAIERARDKVAAKVALEAAGIACTGTVAVIDDHQKLMAFKPTRDMPDSWAIKPARGSQGDGILLAVRREGDIWYKGSGMPMDEDYVLNHIRKVVDGGFSGDATAEDAALIEPLIRADPALADLVPEGLPDLRVICLKDEPLMAMVRLPTNESDGKANLHQRAIGAGVSLETGRITRALVKGTPITHHPDTGVNLIGFEIPGWDRVLELASKCGPAIGLGYSGSDIVLDVNDGPLIIEVNAHPGIEIQNINQLGLKAQMEVLGEVLK